jgi:hypothetical protein
MIKLLTTGIKKNAMPKAGLLTPDAENAFAFSEAN